jgi:hypothetical protein
LSALTLDDATIERVVPNIWRPSRACAIKNGTRPAPPPRVEQRAAVRRLRDFTALAAHMTPDARELGLTVALPEEFVMASPAGFEPATFRLEGGCSVH